MRFIAKLIALPLLIGLLSAPGFAQPEQTLPGIVPAEDIAGTAPSIHPLVTTGSGDAIQQVDWREEYAYALGIQAYVVGYPWIYLPKLRWLWVTQPRDPKHVPYVPLNQFWHHRALADASYKDGGGANNDTLYTIAWLNLAKEPLILSVPDTGERYYTLQMASLDGDNFAYVGKRATGTKAGNYAIIGPNWKGNLPEGVKPLERSRTNSVLIFGRTLISGPDDLPAAHTIQDQYKMTPLSQWGKEYTAVDDRDVWQPSPASDPLGEWKTMNRAMTEDPPLGEQAPLMKSFSGIGIGPGMDVEKMDAATKRGLARAAVTGLELLRASIEVFYGGTKVNGWDFTTTTYGRDGLAGAYLERAGPQCLAGIIGNENEEAMYMPAWRDANGDKLHGDKKYRIHFDAGNFPPVQEFWSLTMYGYDYNLVENPINRYSLGDRSGLQHDADGGITIYIQSESPGAELESNWLPAPKDPFYVVLRNYNPKKELLERKWVPPAVVPLP